MGNRKRLAAEKRKETNRSAAVARLNDIPTSPRKMRIVADTIRGVQVDHALNLLKFSKKEAARKLEKLLQSAIFNWQLKNEGERVDDSDLYVKKIFVDEGVTLKRLQPAPHGRAYRIRKRSNHVTLEIGSKVLESKVSITPKEETKAEAADQQKSPSKAAQPAAENAAAEKPKARKTSKAAQPKASKASEAAAEKKKKSAPESKSTKTKK